MSPRTPPRIATAAKPSTGPTHKSQTPTNAVPGARKLIGSPVLLPPPRAVVVFERLRLTLRFFPLPPLLQGARLFFFHLPPIRRVAAGDRHRRCEPGRVDRPRWRAGHLGTWRPVGQLYCPGD